MRIVSPFLKQVVYPALSAAGVFRRTSAPGLAIVTYHGVLPPGYQPMDAGFDGNLIGAEMLRRQLRMLKAGFNVISPGEVLAWREGRFQFPERAALLTCDDGLLNCLTDMLPVLEQEGVTCLFFVTGASAGDARVMLWYEDLFLALFHAPAGTFEIKSDGVALSFHLGSREERRAAWWSAVKRLSQLDAETRTSFLQALRIRLDAKAGLDVKDQTSCRRFGLMTRAELRQLVAAGMTVGAHTLSHPMLSEAPTELAYAEISESRARLEAALQERVWAFAYPFGDPQSVTQEVLAMPQRAGFEAAFVNFGGGLGVETPPYAIPRVHVTAGMSLAEFEAHVSGFHSRMQSVGRRLQA